MAFRNPMDALVAPLPLHELAHGLRNQERALRDFIRTADLLGELETKACLETALAAVGDAREELR